MSKQETPETPEEFLQRMADRAVRAYEKCKHTSAAYKIGYVERGITDILELSKDEVIYPHINLICDLIKQNIPISNHFARAGKGTFQLSV